MSDTHTLIITADRDDPTDTDLDDPAVRAALDSARQGA